MCGTLVKKATCPGEVFGRGSRGRCTHLFCKSVVATGWWRLHRFGSTHELGAQELSPALSTMLIVY